MKTFEMNKLNSNQMSSFKDKLHARPYIKFENNLKTFHFAYLIKDNNEDNLELFQKNKKIK